MTCRVGQASAAPCKEIEMKMPAHVATLYAVRTICVAEASDLAARLVTQMLSA